jgi:hypothetical protein
VVRAAICAEVKSDTWPEVSTDNSAELNPANAAVLSAVKLVDGMAVIFAVPNPASCAEESAASAEVVSDVTALEVRFPILALLSP